MRSNKNISIFKAEYDYRVMQAFKITDPNDNITEFDFSPLGLLRATAVIGKGTQGDYKAAIGDFYERFAPSVRMEYDFFAFMNEGNPIWVKTIQREQHWQDDPDLDSPTIVSKEYSDGFGRLLQTRAQAEDVIFGNQTFGGSGLNKNQNAPNAPAVGIKREENDPLNVVVSGWKIYNNKGEVVEQYEPFFDKGFDYTLPQLSTTGGIVPPQLGVKIKMYYDPLGRVVKTVNPDNSEQRVIYGIPNALDTPNSFTPTSWENYAYDANDLAPLTNPTNSNVPASHWYTPKSSLVDALGRTIQTTEHKAHYNGEDYENVVMKYRYDIRGNLLEVRDPYNRKVFEHVYDLRPAQEDENGEKQPLPPLWTRHIDAGDSRILFDATAKPIESSDAKDARSLSTYDTFSRPVNGWSQNNDLDTLRLTAHAIYGEEATDPKDSNLLGQLWQQYDESGKVESVEFDFKGNLLSKKQLVISSAELKSTLDNYQTYLVDWTGLPNILGTQEFETSSEFDALNRPVKITLPENVNTDRKEIIPTYNRAGGLEKVHYDGTEYVNNIVYNAKGQRILIAFGNDVMTRYVYSNKTFRLLRQKSEKFTYSQMGDTHTYTPEAGTKRQDDGFNFDLVGNIMKILHRTTDCGISGSILGSDALDRKFEYDPLYRVVSANGRESDTQDQNDYLYNDAPIPGSPNANNVRTYARQYSYDRLGNIQQLKQLGTNGFTRNFVYNMGGNTLQKIETATPTLIENFTYDNCGNQLTAGTTRNYIWNAANQLITYYNQAGVSNPTIFAQYDYDGGGNRVSKLIRTGSAGSPVYERTIYIDGVFEYHILENGTTYEKNYVHVMDDTSRIAMVRIGDQFPDDISDSVTYNLEDQIGSSSIRLNTSGGIIDKEEYYPFGDSSLRIFSKKRYRYTGKERDAESGLYYYGARYYAPWTCRFVSVDPLASDYPYLTPYNYAGNKPITFKDIDGMQSDGDQPVNNGGGNGGATENIQGKIYSGGMLPEVDCLYIRSQSEYMSSKDGYYDYRMKALKEEISSIEFYSLYHQNKWSSYDKNSFQLSKNQTRELQKKWDLLVWDSTVNLLNKFGILAVGLAGGAAFAPSAIQLLGASSTTISQSVLAEQVFERSVGMTFDVVAQGSMKGWSEINFVQTIGVGAGGIGGAGLGAIVDYRPMSEDDIGRELNFAWNKEQSWSQIGVNFISNYGFGKIGGIKSGSQSRFDRAVTIGGSTFIGEGVSKGLTEGPLKK